MHRVSSVVYDILYPFAISFLINDKMTRTLKIDKLGEMVTIELDKNELKSILDSIDLMIQDWKSKFDATICNH
jgi:hypothetical protein